MRIRCGALLALALILLVSSKAWALKSPSASRSLRPVYFDYEDYYLRRYTDHSARTKQDPYRFYHLYDYYRDYYHQPKADVYKFYLDYGASRSPHSHFQLRKKPPRTEDALRKVDR